MPFEMEGPLELDTDVPLHSVERWRARLRKLLLEVYLMYGLVWYAPVVYYSPERTDLSKYSYGIRSTIWASVFLLLE
jgi:hypothetical protein